MKIEVDYSKWPSIWGKPAQEITYQMAECDERIDELNQAIAQIAGQVRYWEGRKEKLDRDLLSLRSRYQPAIYEIDEPKLHQRFIDLFGGDFDIHREVCGKYLYDAAPKDPRIDFLIFPKDHIQAPGFPPVWVGIEAKVPKDSRRGAEVTRQAENYREAIFNRPAAGIVDVRPDMVLIYPPINYFFTSAEQAKYVKVHVHKARVGSIEYIREAPYRAAHWKISFADDTAYFYSDTGLSNGGAVLNNTYLGNGRVK
jgi:hypothetical protein